MTDKIHDSLNILISLGMPKEQQNDRTALCLLALTDLKPDSEWKSAKSPLIGITPMMEFALNVYGKKYAPNSRETFRRFSMHQLVQAGIALYNPDNPSRPVNSPKAVYQISPAALEVIRAYKTASYESMITTYNETIGTLSALYAKERDMVQIPVILSSGQEIRISSGEHSQLIKEIIESMAPRFLHNSTLVYVGDTGDKWGYFDEKLAKDLNLRVDQHGKMPDVIFYIHDKNWIIFVESVTSHGPVDSKRLIEMEELFRNIPADKIYISAFPSKQIMARYSTQIAWETEVWIADNPTHMIHFNGNKFLGPY